MTIKGYARVSTVGQTLEAQHGNTEAGRGNDHLQ
jgi:hypothetical protein